jgi:hypothetical protein
LPRLDLSRLEDNFTEEEVLAVIQEIATEKAPGPDGFISLFLKHSWDLIKGDILAAFQFFHQQHEQHFRLLNTAHLVLIPKKSDAQCIADFRPISLSHSISKLISKCLASRLSAELNSLVSRAQSAFIRKRSIQDNFLYTQTSSGHCIRQKSRGYFLSWTLIKPSTMCGGTFLWKYCSVSGLGQNGETGFQSCCQQAPPWYCSMARGGSGLIIQGVSARGTPCRLCFSY